MASNVRRHQTPYICTLRNGTNRRIPLRAPVTSGGRVPSRPHFRRSVGRVHAGWPMEELIASPCARHFGRIRSAGGRVSSSHHRSRRSGLRPASVLGSYLVMGCSLLLRAWNPSKCSHAKPPRTCRLAASGPMHAGSEHPCRNVIRVAPAVSQGSGLAPCSGKFWF